MHRSVEQEGNSITPSGSLQLRGRPALSNPKVHQTSDPRVSEVTTSRGEDSFTIIAAWLTCKSRGQDHCCSRTEEYVSWRKKLPGEDEEVDCGGSSKQMADVEMLI